MKEGSRRVVLVCGDEDRLSHADMQYGGRATSPGTGGWGWGAGVGGGGGEGASRVEKAKQWILS